MTNSGVVEKVAVGVVVLVITSGIATYAYLYSTSEVLIAHGTVTEKRYVPERSYTYFTTDNKGFVETHHGYDPPKYWVTMTCPEKEWTWNDSRLYHRFREGDSIKVLYLSKVGYVKQVYREEDEIPVER
jgi:hypothetical protein